MRKVGVFSLWTWAILSLGCGLFTTQKLVYLITDQFSDGYFQFLSPNQAIFARESAFPTQIRAASFTLVSLTLKGGPGQF